MKYFVFLCVAVSCWLIVPWAYQGPPPNDEARMFGEFGRLIRTACSVPFAVCLGLMPAAFLYWITQKRQPQ